jgi:hypothetical protein
MGSKKPKSAPDPAIAQRQREAEAKAKKERESRFLSLLERGGSRIGTSGPAGDKKGKGAAVKKFLGRKAQERQGELSSLQASIASLEKTQLGYKDSAGNVARIGGLIKQQQSRIAELKNKPLLGR